MERIKYYSASADVARATGTISTVYRTKDDRFILSEKQVKAVLMKQPSKTTKDLDVVEISEIEARKLIVKGGYRMGEEINNK